MNLVKGLVFAERPHMGDVTPTTFEDESRYNIPIIGEGSPTWTKQGRLWLRTYDGASQYHYATNANTKHLAFTPGNYSISFWINLIDTGSSEIIIARYELDVGGWEIYWTYTGGVYSITQRHHHAGTVIAEHPRTASYSVGWNAGIPTMVTLVYTGNATDALHYRNGKALEVTSSAGGLLDPESTTYDLVTLRYTKASYWVKGQTGLLKIWNGDLSAEEVAGRFENERRYLGL